MGRSLVGLKGKKSEAMRIAYLAVEFPTEGNFDHGAGVSMGREVRALADLGHDVTTLCWGNQSERLSFYGTPLYRLSRRLPLWARVIDKLTKRAFSILLLSKVMSRKTWAKFRELHGQQPFDVVVAASSSSVSYDTAKRTDVPVVVRLSQYQPDWTALDGPHTLGWRLRDSFEVRTLRLADGIWTKSEFMARVLKQKTGLVAETIEPPFIVDVDRVDETILDEAGLRNTPFFLCLGPLGLRKGSDIIAKAAANVVERHPNIVFVFVGTSKSRRSDGMGTWDWVCAQAAPRAVDNMRYLGKVSRQRMYALIEHAKATVIAARTDNLPNASYETMGTGNVLVASRDASFEQLIEDGVSGLLFDNGNPVNLAETLQRVLRLSEGQQRDLGRNAKRRIEAMAPDRAGLRLAEFLEQVMQSKNGSAHDRRHIGQDQVALPRRVRSRAKRLSQLSQEMPK